MLFEQHSDAVSWSSLQFAISSMTPVWIFPAYPLLVIGSFAGVLSSKTEGGSALAIIVGGFMFQGIGFMMSLTVYSALLYRLMTHSLPTESLGALFIAVGPSAFTVAGVISMGEDIPRVIPDNFMGVGKLAGTITMVVANWVGIWLWG